MNNDNAEKMYPNTNFDTVQTGKGWYPNTNLPEKIEIPAVPCIENGPGRIESIKLCDVPVFVMHEMETALRLGRQKEDGGAPYWCLGRSEAIDKHTFEKLKSIQRKFTGNCHEDKSITEEFVKAFRGLKVSKK